MVSHCILNSNVLPPNSWLEIITSSGAENHQTSAGRNHQTSTWLRILRRMLNTGKASGGGRYNIPHGRVHVNSHKALGHCEKAPSRMFYLPPPSAFPVFIPHFVSRLIVCVCLFDNPRSSARLLACPPYVPASPSVASRPTRPWMSSGRGSTWWSAPRAGDRQSPYTELSSRDNCLFGLKWW